MTTESPDPAMAHPSVQRVGSATTEDGVATSGPEATSLQGASEEVRLCLKGDASLRRRLIIWFDRRNAWLTVHVLSARSRTVAFVSPKLSECRLEVDPRGDYQLRADLTIFDVTPKEAAKIHATFAPLGLKSGFQP